MIDTKKCVQRVVCFWSWVIVSTGRIFERFHYQVQNVTFPKPFKKKCISEIERLGSIIIFHLSKLWKAKFFILCDATFQVRLQGKFEINRSWEWKSLAFRASDSTGVILIGFVTKIIRMLGMRPRIIFDRSIIDTSQSCDTSRSGLVNLKANSTLF